MIRKSSDLWISTLCIILHVAEWLNINRILTKTSEISSHEFSYSNIGTLRVRKLLVLKYKIWLVVLFRAQGIESAKHWVDRARVTQSRYHGYYCQIGTLGLGLIATAAETERVQWAHVDSRVKRRVWMRTRTTINTNSEFTWLVQCIFLVWDIYPTTFQSSREHLSCITCTVATSELQGRWYGEEELLGRVSYRVLSEVFV
jgi:hypothetical protein